MPELHPVFIASEYVQLAPVATLRKYLDPPWPDECPLDDWQLRLAGTMARVKSIHYFTLRPVYEVEHYRPAGPGEPGWERDGEPNVFRLIDQPAHAQPSYWHEECLLDPALLKPGARAAADWFTIQAVEMFGQPCIHVIDGNGATCLVMRHASNVRLAEKMKVVARSRETGAFELRYGFQSTIKP